MTKLKFGGFSFGGKYPHVTVFGKKHKLRFGRSKKKKGYIYEVLEKRKIDFFMKYFYFLFPLYDLFVYFVLNPPKQVTETVKPVSDTIANVLPDTGLYISSWIYILIMIFYTFTLYYLLYLMMFKGVRKWHGTEHKIISAAENNDLKNVKTYNPIHERCGGTILPTFIFGYVLFLVFYAITGIPYGEMTLVTILVFLNVKFFHKYDKFGIWFGKKFQKYVSISEPDDWQLKLGTEGMKELVKAEQNKSFKKFEKIYGNKEIQIKYKRTIKQYIPTIIITGMFFIIVFGTLFAPPVPESDYITDKYVNFNGLPGETKTDYILTQVNATSETLEVGRIKVWGVFFVENQTFNETIYDKLNLYVSINNETNVFINETEHPEKPKYWEMNIDNYSFLPIKQISQVNFTFEFELPEGNYNETVLFNYTPVIRFTSFV